MEQRFDDKLICLAAVAGAHGVRGAIKLRCFTETPENVAAYGPVFDAQGVELFTLKVVGPWKAGVIVKPSGINDRNAAEALKGIELFVPRRFLPQIESGEFYFEDLIGLAAVDENGPVGTVKTVEDHGAGAILAIETADGNRIDLPFTQRHVPEVALNERRIAVRLPVEVAS